MKSKPRNLEELPRGSNWIPQEPKSEEPRIKTSRKRERNMIIILTVLI